MRLEVDDWFDGNSHKLRLVGLDDEDGNPVADATVTLESLKDQRGAVVAGIAYPLTMPAEGDGDYAVVLAHDTPIARGHTYTAVVRADTAGRRGQWRLTFNRKDR